MIEKLKTAFAICITAIIVIAIFVGLFFLNTYRWGHCV